MTYAARGKYDLGDRAARYAQRSARRDAEEWTLLASLVDAIDPAPLAAIDVPCGTGRIAERLLARGIPTRAMDLSPSMRAQARLRLAPCAGLLGIEAFDLEAGTAPEAWRADLVVCFRFLHHLPDAATRGRVLSTLAALTRRDLLLSFHHPVSVHHLTRTLKGLVLGRRSDRHALTAGRLAREARAAGLELVGTRALARWRRDLWVAHLKPRA